MTRSSRLMPTENIAWRIFLRLFHGRRQWHNRRFPPAFQANLGTESVDFEFNGLRMTCRRAEMLQDTFGGPCNILLSGPSVGTVREPRLLQNSFLIGVNGSPCLLDREGKGMDMYIVDDPAYLRNRTADFLRFARCAAFTLVNYGIVAELMHRGLTIPNGVIVESIGTPFRRPKPPPARGIVFSRRFSDGLKPYGTVAYVALQAAYCLGFREVRLFGLDLTATGRYYAERQPEPIYLQDDQENSILRPFRHVGEMVARGEWQVVNCSLQSRLPPEVLPRLDPDTVLSASARHQLVALAAG